MSTETMTKAGWFVDPLGRFDGRFFDGMDWTAEVSASGRRTVDPDWPPSPTSAAETASVITWTSSSTADSPSAVETAVAAIADTEPTGRMRLAERRGEGERRQITLARPGQPDRRKADRRQREITIPKA